MERSRDERRHRRLPRPYAGRYPARRNAAYRPVESGPDPLRTLDIARIGQYPLLTAWAALHKADLTGRPGVQFLDRAIDERTIDVGGPIMSEVAYFVGDLVCDEQAGWRWNVDAWGLPVLALDSEDGRGPTVWDVLKFVKRRINQESPSLVEAINRFGTESEGPKPE